MKKTRLLLFQRLLLGVICFLISTLSVMADTYYEYSGSKSFSMEVGETKTLNPTSESGYSYYTTQAYQGYFSSLPEGLSLIKEYNVTVSQNWKNQTVTFPYKCDIKAIKPGTYTVTHYMYADSKNRIFFTGQTRDKPEGQYWVKYTYYITVNAPKPTSVSFSPSSQEIALDESINLSPTLILTPEYASTTFSWESDATHVATVSNGIVKGVGAGTASIKVTTANGKTASCKIIVKDNTIKTLTKEGVEMTFKILSETDKTCVVGRGAIDYRSGYPAIDTSVAGSVSIPEQAEGYRVVGINDYAFINRSSITSVEIPKSVKTIGENGFYGCSALTEIVIPKGVTEIKAEAFRNCTNLTYIEIPFSINTISYSVFLGCTNLVSIKSYMRTPYSISNIFPDDVYESATLFVPQGTKEQYSKLNYWKKFTTILEMEATELTELSIPTELTISAGTKSTIKYTFEPQDAALNMQWSSKNENIATVDQNGTVIGWTEGETMITVTAENGISATCKVMVTGHIEDGFVFSAPTVEGIDMDFKVISAVEKICQVGKGSYTNTEDGKNYCYRSILYNTIGPITIPDYVYGFKVIGINDGAFLCTENITNVHIPNTVEYINEYAFQGCSGLTSMHIPNSVKKIGKYAISKCTNLIELTFSEKIDSIIDGICWQDSALSSIVIPASVKYIGYSAFSSCTNLYSVESNIQEPFWIPSSAFPADVRNNATLYVPYGKKVSIKKLTIGATSRILKNCMNTCHLLP